MLTQALYDGLWTCHDLSAVVLVMIYAAPIWMIADHSFPLFVTSSWS